MIQPYRKLRFLEGCLIPFDCHVQFGLEFSDKSVVKDYIRMVDRSFAGLHTKLVGKDEIAENKDPITIKRIPKFADNSLELATTYASKNRTPYTEALATKFVSDNKIVVDASHSVTDGMFIIQLVEALQNGSIPKELVTKFYSQESLFEEEIKNRPLPETNVTDLSHLNHHFKEDEPHHRPNQFIQKMIPFEKLSCYNKRTQKVSKLTESLWTSEMLAAVAMNGEYDKLGLMTCVNLRKSDKFDPSHPLQMSNIDVVADAKPSEKVGDLAARMRENFERKFHTPGLRLTQTTNQEEIKGFKGWAKQGNYSFLALSHIGKLKFKRPISNVTIHTEMFENPYSPQATIFSHTVESEAGRFLKYRYNFMPSHFPAREAEYFAKSMKFALQNIKFDEKIEDAVKRIVEFQSKM